MVILEQSQLQSQQLMAKKHLTITYHFSANSMNLSSTQSQSIETGHASKSRKGMPKRMANYDVIKLIGKGGFSKVLLVRQKSSGKLFAMKIINKEMIKQREFCAGGELFYHLQIRRRFTEAQTKFISAQIILALEYLHKNDVLYRDLKVSTIDQFNTYLQPENVLVDIDGNIKLSDFGLSKENFKFNHLSDSFCGSPEYISPEMLLRGLHSRMLDFYQFGALLYEMLTGLPPCYNENKDVMYQQIMKKNPQYPQFLSPDAVNILKGLLQKEPEERLGFKNQFEEIKQHPFYKEINWNAMVKKEFDSKIPNQVKYILRPILGRSYFDTQYLEKLTEELIADLFQENDIKKPSQQNSRQNQQQIQLTYNFKPVQSTLDGIEDESPIKIQDKLKSNQSKEKVHVTGSGNLVFGKSIQNLQSQVQKNNEQKVDMIQSSSPISMSRSIQNQILFSIKTIENNHSNPQTPDYFQSNVKQNQDLSMNDIQPVELQKPISLAKIIKNYENQYLFDDPIGSGQIPQLNVKIQQEDSPSCQTDSSFDDQPLLEEIKIQNMQKHEDEDNPYDFGKLINGDINNYSNEMDGKQRCKSLTPLREINIESQLSQYFDQFNYQVTTKNQSVVQTKPKGAPRKQSQIEQLSNGFLNLKELSKQVIRKRNQLTNTNKKYNELNERYTLNMIKFNEKLNNIVSERKRNLTNKTFEKSTSKVRVSSNQIKSRSLSRNQSQSKIKSQTHTRNPSYLNHNKSQNNGSRNSQGEFQFINLYPKEKKSFQEMIRTIKVIENKVSEDQSEVNSHFNNKMHKLSSVDNQSSSSPSDVYSQMAIAQQSDISRISESHGLQKANDSPLRRIFNQRMNEVRSSIIKPKATNETGQKQKRQSFSIILKDKPVTEYREKQPNMKINILSTEVLDKQKDEVEIQKINLKAGAQTPQYNQMQNRQRKTSSQTIDYNNHPNNKKVNQPKVSSNTMQHSQQMTLIQSSNIPLKLKSGHMKPVRQLSNINKL
ncbi:camp-dependent protein kinase catalytic [Stylonychia lemnae]|uniref:Camp-dependent protein kinase catalytic n=1 Tax=Stylonychia lemnae TaxID=5949 RepID=A0A078AFY6_STYLE|nr:camp-dependent protein kinase catalytic [Stylonychia lemnae]|eukprot:CDW81210.1 camp-dependent protein kinase catalytic [Stylonychia lemnae]